MSSSVFDENYEEETEEVQNPFESSSSGVAPEVNLTKLEFIKETLSQKHQKSSDFTDICDEIDQLSEQIIGIVANIEHVAHNFADLEEKFINLHEKMSEIANNQSEMLDEMKRIYKSNFDLINLIDKNNTAQYLLESSVKELISDVQSLKETE